MKDLPLVSVSCTERDKAVISPAAKPHGYLKSSEEAKLLRGRLLQMILDNERNRRTPPPASKA